MATSFNSCRHRQNRWYAAKLSATFMGVTPILLGYSHITRFLLQSSKSMVCGQLSATFMGVTPILLGYSRITRFLPQSSKSMVCGQTFGDVYGCHTNPVGLV